MTRLLGRSTAAALATALLVVTGCVSNPDEVEPIASVSAGSAVGAESPRAAATTASAVPVRTPVGDAADIGEALNRQLEDTDALRTLRNQLVDQAIAPVVEDERIETAFRRVPRHAFVPIDVRSRAYGDYPLPIEAGQTISQPSLVAEMTELVDVQDGERVLEIGTGSGFQAAILAELTDEVYSVEIIPQLSATARAILDAFGYDDIRLDRRDGYLGWAEEAPFDAIVVTAAADHLPPPLVDQLRDGGRMVIPIGPVGDVQTLWLVTKTGEEVAMEQVAPVQFVPLTREDG